jgi:hypothetical protein
MLLALLLLASPAPPDPHVIRVKQLYPGVPLTGNDYLLIAEALRHPAMRSADLSCYLVDVSDGHGARQVAFLEARQRVIEEQTPDGVEITYLPPDPRCRSMTFVMNRNGKVRRVIHSRH